MVTLFPSQSPEPAQSLDPVCRWRIRLLGGLNAEVDQRSIPFYSDSHTGAVLGYLAYHSGCVERHTLAEMIRPEIAPELALGSLRATLTELRRRLDAPEESLLVGGKTHIGLRAEAVTTDVAAFRAALTAVARADSDMLRLERLWRALTLCEGPLLAKFEQSWIVSEREFLENQRRSALAQWVRLHIALGTPDVARSYVRHAAKQDELEPETCALLMEIELAAGRPGYALRQYEALRAALARENLGPPAPPLEELARHARAAQRHAVTSAPATKRARSRPVSAASSTSSALAPSNLLPPLNGFFGHEREIARLSAALWPSAWRQAPRLITVTGPGGVGKTRLATEVALRMREDYSDRVYFVSLADTDDPARIDTLVADALLVRHDPLEEALPQLQRHIGTAPVLLVLDNYEHLAERGAAALSLLLRSLPPLTVCLTSRRPAEIQGEQIMPLLPLPLPSEGLPTSELLPFACVALFLDRARYTRPELAPSEAEMTTIAAICRRLEGTPLALELAAAWANGFSLRQIEERLARPFDLLVSGHRDVPERHRSLRATLDWSYDLLTPTQQRVLASLAVFRGGWTLEAAEAILEMGTPLPVGIAILEMGTPLPVGKSTPGQDPKSKIDPQALWTALRELQGRSLIQTQETPDGAIRYRMFETIREYALERRPEAERREARSRHAELFRRWMEEVCPHLHGNEAARWFRLLEPERANFAAAQEALVAEEKWRQAIDLADGLALWKQLQGENRTAGDHFERALELAHRLGEPGIVARQLIGLGHNRLTLSRYDEARRLLQEAQTLAERLGDAKKVAGTHYSLGGVELAAGNLEAAQSHYERCLIRFRHWGDGRREAFTLLNLGAALTEQLQSHIAVTHFQRALEIFRALEDTWGCAITRQALGTIATREGNATEARRLLEKALAGFVQVGAQTYQATSYYYLGDLALQQGDLATAREHFGESLRLLLITREPRRVAETLEGFGRLAVAAEEFERAAHLFGAADALRQAIHAPLSPRQRLVYEPALAVARVALSETEFATHWTAGQALSWEEAIAYARPVNSAK